MSVVVKILQFVGILNVCFIIFNGSYQISSEYFSNTTMIAVLLTLVVVSSIKDIFDFIGYQIVYKPLYHLFRLITLIISGVLSSFVILIPKLIFIESHHIDSMPIKFTAKITRIWDKSELSAHLMNLIDSRGISNLISANEQNQLIESSDSMYGLRAALNTLVNERSVSLKPEVVEPLNVAVVVEPSWISENILLVTIATAVAVVVVAGIGYLVYKNYNAPAPVEDRNIFDNPGEEDLEDFFDPDLMSDLHSKPSSFSDENLHDRFLKAAVHTEEVRTSLSTEIADKTTELGIKFEEQIKGLKSTIKGLRDDFEVVEEVNGVIDTSVSTLTDKIDEISRSMEANISTLTGNIEKTKSAMEANISTLTGNIEKTKSAMEANISTLTGNIEKTKSAMEANISTITDKVELNDIKVMLSLQKIEGSIETHTIHIGKLVMDIQRKAENIKFVAGHAKANKANVEVLLELSRETDAKIKEFSDFSEKHRAIAEELGRALELEKSSDDVIANLTNQLKVATKDIEDLEHRSKHITRILIDEDKALSKRIDVIEETVVEEAKSSTEFLTSLVDTAKDQILKQVLGEEEVKAVRALIGNETIRDMLKATEVKKIIENMKKG